jgi:hypothetical protein
MQVIPADMLKKSTQWQEAEPDNESKENAKNSGVLYEMVESIVERLKVEGDSLPNSQCSKVLEVRHRLQLLEIQKNLKQTRAQLKEFQSWAASNKSKVAEEWSSLLQLKAQELVVHFQEERQAGKEKEIEKNEKIRRLTEKICCLEEELKAKNLKIKEMKEKISQASSENQELNEKVFDLEQKISQWDLEVERKLKAYDHSTNNSKGSPPTNCEEPPQKLEKAMSEQEFEKFSRNFLQLNEKL